MRTVHLISYFEKNQGKYTLLGRFVGEDPGTSMSPPFSHHLDHAVPTFLFRKVVKILLSLL